MGVSYNKRQREYAKEHNEHLITISVKGMTFQGPVSKEEADDLAQYLVRLLERRYTDDEIRVMTEAGHGRSEYTYGGGEAKGFINMPDGKVENATTLPKEAWVNDPLMENKVALEIPIVVRIDGVCEGCDGAGSKSAQWAKTTCVMAEGYRVKLGPKHHHPYCYYTKDRREIAFKTIGGPCGECHGDGKDHSTSH